MLIETCVLDESLNTVFQAHTKISAHNLIEIAKSREGLARSKGRTWVADAIAVFGMKLISLMRSATLGVEVDNAAIQVAMAAWLFDSIYAEVDEDTFARSELQFTMLSNGAVEYKRQPALG